MFQESLGWYYTSTLLEFGFSFFAALRVHVYEHHFLHITHINYKIKAAEKFTQTIKQLSDEVRDWRAECYIEMTARATWMPQTERNLDSTMTMTIIGHNSWQLVLEYHCGDLKQKSNTNLQLDKQYNNR